MTLHDRQFADLRHLLKVAMLHGSGYVVYRDQERRVTFTARLWKTDVLIATVEGSDMTPGPGLDQESGARLQRAFNCARNDAARVAKQH